MPEIVEALGDLLEDLNVGGSAADLERHLKDILPRPS